MEDEKKIVPVEMEGKVEIKKPGIGERMKNAFISDDFKNVRSYLLFDVIVPAVKDTTMNFLTSGLEMLFYGESRGNRNIRRDGRRTYTDYSSYHGNRNTPPFTPNRAPSYSYNPRAAHDFSAITFESRKDAENVLSMLVDFTVQYGMTSVADFYELAGVDSSYTDQGFGWSELSTACVDRVRNGYILRLPRPIPLTD